MRSKGELQFFENLASQSLMTFYRNASRFDMAKKRWRRPALQPGTVIRVLLRNGFRELRPTKHRHFADHALPPHVVTVPYHGRDLKRATLHSIIRQAGWTVAEFLEKL